MTNQEKFAEVFGESISEYQNGLHLDRKFYGFEYREWLEKEYEEPKETGKGGEYQ